ncbi:MAG: OmpH family outer membrane protein [Phycisphaerales bacterium]
MKRTTQLLTLTTMVLAAILITMAVSSADASRRPVLEAGDIAFVDVFKLIDKALLGEEKLKARDDFNAKSQQAIDGLQQQLSDLQTQLSTMDQTDPNAANTYQQYQQVSQQLDSASQQINNAYQGLIAQQLASAYSEIYAAANEVGAAEGYSFVFATRSTGELIQTGTITGITQEILARPLMTPPAGVDITELVRVKLGYPEKAPEPVTDASDEAGGDAGEGSAPADGSAVEPETPAQEVPVSEDD